MITLTDVYPPDVFLSPWDALGQLADMGRLLICEEAVAECEDERQQEFFASHAEMLISFDYIQDHFARFQEQAPTLGIQLTNPEAVRDSADPYVVALALATEKRQIDSLQTPTDSGIKCAVVSQESRKGGLKKIPNVCDLFAIKHINLMDLFRNEAMKF